MSREIGKWKMQIEKRDSSTSLGMTREEGIGNGK